MFDGMKIRNMESRQDHPAGSFFARFSDIIFDIIFVQIDVKPWRLEQTPLFCFGINNPQKALFFKAFWGFQVVTRRRFELRTPCLKGRCSAD